MFLLDGTGRFVDIGLTVGEAVEFVTVLGEADIVQSQRVELAGRVDLTNRE